MLYPFKIISLFFILLLPVHQSSHINANETPQTFLDGSVLVHIKFKDVINGYKVEIFWYPNQNLPGSGERLAGAAVLKFADSINAQTVSIATDSFFLYKKTLGSMGIYKENGEINRDKSLYSKPFSLNYSNWEPRSIKQVDKTNSEATFFFEDVNFDSQKELIIIESMAAQRFRDRLAVYDLGSGRYSDEPYISFDSETKFNSQNETIELNNTSGACYSDYLTYKFNKRKLKFELIKLIRYTIVDQKDGQEICTQFVYKVDNNSESGLPVYLLKSKKAVSK